MLGFLLALGAIGLIAGLFGGDSSDSSSSYGGSYSDHDSSSDYDYGDSYSSSSDSEERFENRWPYEYDKETGYSRSSYCNDGNWTDSVGNQYEQVTDCWGNISYEKIEDDE